MVGARADVDLSQVDKAIRRMSRAGVDFRPVWRKVRTPLRKEQRTNIRSQKGPTGTPWKPLAASTVRKRIKNLDPAKSTTKRGKWKKKVVRSVNKILDARMIRKLGNKITRGSIATFAKGPGATIHQGGGVVGRGARLPARPFMYVGDGLARKTAKMITEHLVIHWNGRTSL